MVPRENSCRLLHGPAEPVDKLKSAHQNLKRLAQEEAPGPGASEPARTRMQFFDKRIGTLERYVKDIVVGYGSGNTFYMVSRDKRREILDILKVAKRLQHRLEGDFEKSLAPGERRSPMIGLLVLNGTSPEPGTMLSESSPMYCQDRFQELTNRTCLFTDRMNRTCSICGALRHDWWEKSASSVEGKFRANMKQYDFAQCKQCFFPKCSRCAARTGGADACQNCERLAGWL